MKTKNGVELNIKESEYKIKIYNYNFYFSSAFYLKKFKEEVFEFVEMENIKFNNKYKVKFDLRLYFAIVLFKRIEKRGFYITSDKYINNDITILTENVEFVNCINKH